MTACDCEVCRMARAYRAPGPDPAPSAVQAIADRHAFAASVTDLVATLRALVVLPVLSLLIRLTTRSPR